VKWRLVNYFFYDFTHLLLLPGGLDVPVFFCAVARY
jgi:hypothetical protein